MADGRSTAQLEVMLRIALLDDHPAVLAGLRRLIDAESDLAVDDASWRRPS